MNRTETLQETNSPAARVKGTSYLEVVFRKGDICGTLCLFFGVGSIVVLLGSTVRTIPPYVFADNLTMYEITIIPGLYMKPLTMFSFMFFLTYAFGLNSTPTRRFLLGAPKEVVTVLYVLSWLFVMGSGFEIIYHVVLWSAALSVQGLQNPDTIINPWPTSPYPINVVLSSKLVVLIFTMACFTVDYLARIQRNTSAQRSG